MDFVKGLPSSEGYTVVMVVVDRLSKYAHFIPLHHHYITLKVARVCMENIFKLHGLPQTIVSERDIVFTSQFLIELFRICGTDLLLSLA